MLQWFWVWLVQHCQNIQWDSQLEPKQTLKHVYIKHSCDLKRLLLKVTSKRRRKLNKAVCAKGKSCTYVTSRPHAVLWCLMLWIHTEHTVAKTGYHKKCETQFDYVSNIFVLSGTLVLFVLKFCLNSGVENFPYINYILSHTF